MKIINVIPITKGTNRENLSYFTSKNVESGSLVTVPLRKKIVPAIVSSVKEMKEVKAGLKKTQFRLKPIKSVKSFSFLDPSFIEACKEIADYFVSPLGPVIKDFVPHAILENTSDIVKNDYQIADKHPETILMQGSQKERFQYYKSIIREEFAKNQSVFFCLPTTNEVDEFSKEIQKGIEKYSIALHSKFSRKKIIKIWDRAMREKHPFLIVATKSFLSLPRKDIGTIILEGESSSFYKLQKRPYLNIRKAAEIICKRMKKRLILGDSLIRVETLYKRESSLSRLLSGAEQVVTDMKEEESGWQKSKTLPIISAKLREILKMAYENNEKVILFINRRGYHPTTVCNDCLATILCGNCNTPLVLHKSGRENSWICHKCLTETKMPEQCPYCKSWRMTMLGIGIQKVAEEVSRLFPKFKLFRMDSDIIKNAKQGREIAEKFMATPGSILIGTEILFSYISQPAERVAVISVDALFALPDFRINEKVFHLLLKLRSLAKKTFLIQFRLPRPGLFENVIRGNISGFYKEEIENRKQFQYPPFRLLIKITRESKNKLGIKKEVEAVKKLLKEWNPVVYPAFISKVKNTYIWNILLKADPETWPVPLPPLPPAWKIDVDPETLL
ncbi:MAG: primosomal protein N' [Candidatus Parcubacteria bacterium]|nr:primosomal protein N' [Candidatus Parcubacteria bacterium]